jgi:hypothetical protein
MMSTQSTLPSTWVMTHRLVAPGGTTHDVEFGGGLGDLSWLRDELDFHDKSKKHTFLKALKCDFKWHAVRISHFDRE